MLLSFIIVTGFMKIFRSSCSQVLFKIVALTNFTIFWIKKRLQHRCFSVNIAKFRTAFLQNFSGGCFCILLKVIKQPFRIGANVRTSYILSSQHVLEIYIAWSVKSWNRLFINLSSIDSFCKYLRQGVPYNTGNWHSLWYEQYFSKHHFLDICRCAFNAKIN